MKEWFDGIIDYRLWDIPMGRLGLFITVFIVLLLLRVFVVSFTLKYMKKLALKTKNTLDDDLLRAGTPPYKLLLLTFALILSASVLELKGKSSVFFSHVTRSMIIYAVFWFLYRTTSIVSGLLKNLSEKTESQLDDKIVPFVNKVLGIIVFVIGAMVIIQEWNFDITGIVTGLGLGGLAFALAAKDTLSNIFGLLMILTDKPFKIGDWIKTPHVEGTVEDIGFRSVKVRTFAQALVSVPNSILASNTITNWSRMGKRRIKFNVGFTYSSTKEQLDAFTMKAERYLRNHDDIDQGTIFVKFSGFNDSSLDVFFYFFTKTTNWGEFLDVQHEVKLHIAHIAESLNLSFAFPSQSIYMETPPNKTERVKISDKARLYLKDMKDTEELPESKLQTSNEDSGE